MHASMTQGGEHEGRCILYRAAEVGGKIRTGEWSPSRRLTTILCRRRPGICSRVLRSGHGNRDPSGQARGNAERPGGVPGPVPLSIASL
jgi:hypothetical protein